MAKPRLNMKRIAKEANLARAFTMMDAGTAQRLLPRNVRHDWREVAQALRDERMGERARCTRIVEAALDVCSDPASRAALQFASSQINAKPRSSARRNVAGSRRYRGVEVTAYPDGVVGVRWPAHGFSKLYSPDSAEKIADLLVVMAKKARAAK